MKRIKRWPIVVLLILALIISGVISGVFVRPAQAVGLGDLLKIGGIVLVVSTFGDQINNFINKSLGQHEAAAVGATKVVPIFSVGRGAYVGAAQVIGLPENVRLVQGVAAIEVSIGQLQGTGLIPISTRKPGRTIDRVSGVGVGAVIDFHI
ncbi:MAG TPA: hypothetical protein VHV83_05590 [Armatimonadota bacterium]|nr:hypothetical protein [Armatimonadota bacterium]